MSRTPYLRGILDAVLEPGVEEITVVKAPQIGASEALRSLLGYWIDCDPDPCLWVMPSEQSAREAISERLRPLIEDTPALRRHRLTGRGDNTLATIALDTMTVYTGWAGSTQALATRPVRYVVLDEVDKYPNLSGKETDPLRLAAHRTTTFKHRRRVLKISTPTTRTGMIWREWEACQDKRHYMVPCPHCWKRQRLVFPRVKWPKIDGTPEQQADAIRGGALAWYECEHCQGRIGDQHKPRMMEAGEWASESPLIGVASRVGFHVNGLYSPWLTFSDIAATFLRAKDSPSGLMDFRNAVEAMPYEEQLSKTSAGLIDQKASAAPEPEVVPDWAQVLICTADVQKGHVWYVVRAWGWSMRSQLLAYGSVATPDSGGLDGLAELTLARMFPRANGEALQPAIMAIDARYRTDEVYQFAAADPGRVWPVMGSNSMTAPPVSERSIVGFRGVRCLTINTQIWKDQLYGLINNADPALWQVHSRVSDEYRRQLTSEHKTLDRKSGMGVWTPISEGRANHLWDCEVYQVMVAQTVGLNVSAPAAIEHRKTKQGEAYSPANYKGKW